MQCININSNETVFFEKEKTDPYFIPKHFDFLNEDVLSIYVKMHGREVKIGTIEGFRCCGIKMREFLQKYSREKFETLAGVYDNIDQYMCNVWDVEYYQKSSVEYENIFVIRYVKLKENFASENNLNAVLDAIPEYINEELKFECRNIMVYNIKEEQDDRWIYMAAEKLHEFEFPEEYNEPYNEKMFKRKIF